MPWKIGVSRPAARDLYRLPQGDREAVETAIARLATALGLADVRELRGRTGEWRLRVGRWRVLLALDNRDGQIAESRALP